MADEVGLGFYICTLRGASGQLLVALPLGVKTLERARALLRWKFEQYGYASHAELWRSHHLVEAITLSDLPTGLIA